MNNRIMKRIFVLLVVTIIGMTQSVKSQNVAVKSNVLADAFLNPNLGIWYEFQSFINNYRLKEVERLQSEAIQRKQKYPRRKLSFMLDSVIIAVISEQKKWQRTIPFH